MLNVAPTYLVYICIALAWTHPLREFPTDTRGAPGFFFSAHKRLAQAWHPDNTPRSNLLVVVDKVQEQGSEYLSMTPWTKGLGPW